MAAITATLRGLKRLDRALERAETQTLSAAKAAVNRVSLDVQRAIRRDIDRVFSGSSSFRKRRGKGRKVSKALRRKLFDNKSRGSAALIFSKFGRRREGEFVDFFGPYITGRDITPRRSRFLAIPLQPGRRNRDPGKFKNLETVTVDGDLFLIRSTRTRTTFMFLLIRRAKIRKRLRPARIFRAQARKLGPETKRGFRF